MVSNNQFSILEYEDYSNLSLGPKIQKNSFAI